MFISHSFENKPEFENVTDYLDQLGVAHWPSSEIRSGGSLRDQLRGAIDSSLPESALPVIVQGDVWERKLARVAGRAHELSVRTPSDGATGSPAPNARVSNITVEQLQKLVAGAVALVQARKPGDPTNDARDATYESVAQESASIVLRGAEATNSLGSSAERWERQILWVDDRPDNQTYERTTFESFGLEFVLAQSTDEALEILRRRRFAAIISDMGRREGLREGYRLLDAVRSGGDLTPFFIYSGAGAPEHRAEAAEHGAQGATNAAGELIDMVVAALPSARSRSVAGTWSVRS